MLRPYAAWIAIAIACASCTRDDVRARRSVTRRADLDHRNGLQDVPRHGALALVAGLGAGGPLETRVVLDADALTVRADTGPPGSPVKLTRITAADRDRVMGLAAAAWAAPAPTMPDVSDRLEAVVVADGDDAFVVEGSGPIPAGPAGALRDALFALAGVTGP